MRSTKSADLIGHIKFLPWGQLNGCSMTRPFSKGVACTTSLQCVDWIYFSPFSAEPTLSTIPWSACTYPHPYLMLWTYQQTMSQHPSRKRPRDEDKSEEVGNLESGNLESGATPIKRSAAAAGSSADPETKAPLSGLPRDHTCLIYIVEKKLSSGHLLHLKTVARKKGFPLATSARLMCTHLYIRQSLHT